MRLIFKKEEVALKGTANLIWTKKAKLPECSATAKYGHATIKVTPSLEIGSSGFSLSLLPKKAFSETEEYYIHKEL